MPAKRQAPAGEASSRAIFPSDRRGHEGYHNARVAVGFIEGVATSLMLLQGCTMVPSNLY